MTNTQAGSLLSVYLYKDKNEEEIYKSAEKFARLMNQMDYNLFKESMGAGI